MSVAPNTPTSMQTIFQRATLQMLGIDPSTDPDAFEKVRCGWQQQGQPNEDVNTDFVTVMAVEDDDAVNRVRDVQHLTHDAFNLDRITSYMRVWRISWIFYGPNSVENARKVHSGLFLPDDLTIRLANEDIYMVTDPAAPVRAPEIGPGDIWWERVDFYCQFNELVKETTVVGTFGSAEVIVEEAVTIAEQTVFSDDYTQPPALAGVIAGIVFAGGTGYVVGERLAILQAGGVGGSITITKVLANGVPSVAVQDPSQLGHGYSVTGPIPSLATQSLNGIGTGLLIAIGAVSSSPGRTAFGSAYSAEFAGTFSPVLGAIPRGSPAPSFCGALLNSQPQSDCDLSMVISHFELISYGSVGFYMRWLGSKLDFSDVTQVYSVLLGGGPPPYVLINRLAPPDTVGNGGATLLSQNLSVPIPNGSTFRAILQANTFRVLLNGVDLIAPFTDPGSVLAPGHVGLGANVSSIASFKTTARLPINSGIVADITVSEG